MESWLPFAISAAMALLSVGVNVVLVAFFLGKTKATQDGQAALFAAYQKSQETLLDSFRLYLSDTISGLRREIERFSSFSDSSRVSQAELNQRLTQIEKNVDGMARLREDLIRIGGRFDEHAGRTDETVAASQTAQVLGAKREAEVSPDQPRMYSETELKALIAEAVAK